MRLHSDLTILNGKYRIVRLIGEGGAACVWLAEEPRFENRQVAIKELRSDLLTPSDLEEQERRFYQEVRLAALLEQANAPHTVRAITVEEMEDGVRLLVMVYCDGGSLADLIKAHPQGMPIDQAVRIAIQVCEALQALHSLPMEPVHRDVKPSNILLTREGEALLGDFGLAQLAGASGRSQLSGGHHPGTPMYMAPEQERGSGYLTPASDVYALGCVLWEMLTGQRYKRSKPGTPPSQLRRDVPAWLDQVVMKAVAGDAWERWSSAGEMAGALSAGAPAARSAKPERPPRTQPKAPKQPPAQAAGAPLIAAAHTGSHDGAGRRRHAWLGWLAGAVAAMALLLFWSLSGGIRGGGDATATSTTAVPAVAHITDTSTVAPSRETPAAPTDAHAPPIDTSIPSTDTLSPLTDTLTLPTNTLVPPKIGGGGGNQAPVFWHPPLVTAPPVSPTDTPVQPTKTLIPPTLTPQPDAVVNTQNANMRAGPGTAYETLGSYPQGTALAVTGKNTTGDWLQVQAPDGKAGWMASSLLTVNTNLDQVAVAAAPPTPTPAAPVGGDMVFVPAGEFLMGSPEGQGDSDERPQHTVYLDAFYIDKTEVTAAQYGYCVMAGVCSATTGDCTHGVAGKEAHPINCVDWDDAAAYCKWAGKRLPTEAEWEKAARGTDDRLYPWGNQTPDSTRANFAGRIGSTTAVGQYLAGTSPYGALDMAGNVWEWVVDWYDGGYYAQSPRQNPTGPGSASSWPFARVLRGGSFYDDEALVRATSRGRNHPGYELVNIGFRCARSP